MGNGRKLFVAACAVALGVVAPLHAIAETTMTKLGGLPGGYSTTATVVNDAGVIVGYSGTGRGPHAVRWELDGTVTDLGVLPGSDYNSSYAHGINNSGIVVGESVGEAVRWNADGAIEILADLPGYSENRAQAINDSGVIAGTVRDPVSGAQRAVRWNLDGTVTELEVRPGDTSSIANGINADGTIVGALFGAGGVHAASWSQDGTLTELGHLSTYPGSEARGSTAAV